MPLAEEKFWPLSCGHMFHRDCIEEYLKNLITEKKFPIKCPSDGCAKEMAVGDIREIMSDEYVDKFN